MCLGAQELMCPGAQVTIVGRAKHGPQRADTTRVPKSAGMAQAEPRGSSLAWTGINQARLPTGKTLRPWNRSLAWLGFSVMPSLGILR